MNQVKLTLKSALLVLASVVSLTACKKNDNSETSRVPNIQPFWANCNNCANNIGQPIPGLVGVRSSTTNENVLFSFDLVVDQRVANLNWNDPKAILMYTGPVSLQGALRVQSAGDIMVCNAPPGDYEIRPLSSSAISNGGVLQYGTFEAISGNGSRIIFRVGNSQIYNAQDPQGVSRNSQTNRIAFNLMLDQVNGIYCGQLSTR